MSEFHAETSQAIASMPKGLDKGPYVVARAESKPTILQTKGDKSNNEPPRPINVLKSHGLGPIGNSIATDCTIYN